MIVFEKQNCNTHDYLLIKWLNYRKCLNICLLCYSHSDFLDFHDAALNFSIKYNFNFEITYSSKTGCRAGEGLRKSPNEALELRDWTKIN